MPKFNIGDILIPKDGSNTNFENNYAAWVIEDIKKCNHVIVTNIDNGNKSYSLIRADTNPWSNNEGTLLILYERLDKHFISVSINPEDVKRSKFKLGSIIKSKSSDLMLDEDYSKELTLDAREHEFTIYRLDIYGNCDIKRVDNKVCRNGKNTYSLHLSRMNKCFKIVKAKKVTSTSSSRLDFIK